MNKSESFMKQLIFGLLVCFVLTAHAQNQSLFGEYSLKHDLPEGLLEYKLKLNSDGSFVFRYYDKIYKRIQKERIQYAKGTWKSEKNLVYFFKHKSDVNEAFELNFNNSKARFITKSPRDRSAKVVKTALLFYESDILRGVKLFKN